MSPSFCDEIPIFQWLKGKLLSRTATNIIQECKQYDKLKKNCSFRHTFPWWSSIYLEISGKRLRKKKIEDRNKAIPTLIFVYVIGLHAVQFGNNWMKNIPRTAQIARGRRQSPILLSEGFLNLIISKLDKHVVLLPINYVASQTIQRKRLFPERKKYSNSKLT